MNLREQRKALIAEARVLGEKAQGENREFTEEEADRVTAIKAEVADLDARIKRADAARAAVKAITEGAEEDEVRDAQVPGGTKANGITVRDRAPEPFKSLGQAYVETEAYQRFAKAHPSGVGSGTRIALDRTYIGDYKDIALGRKADLLTTEIARIQPVRYPTLDMIDRPRLTLLDIISHGTMAGAFEYVQIVDVTRGAGLVAEATGAVDEVTGADEDPLKPTSDFTTALADAKPFTYADGFEVTNQLLADAPAFASFLNAELAYSINTVIEDMILNGTGTNGEPRGILNTTGVQTQALSTDMVTTVRKSITKVTRKGGAVTGVVMSPEHDEAWDLLKDGNDRYYGQGPFGSGPGTAWGRPRVVSELLSGTNTMIIGDFSTVALLDREGLSIEAFNQHKDFAQRNKVYVRAELRAGQVIWRPNRLVVATVA